jgi:MFS family permease
MVLDQWLKYAVLVELSLLGFMSGLAGNMTNPAVDQILHEFTVSPHVSTFQLTITAAGSALAGLIFISIANIYGHRLVFMTASSLTLAFSIAAAESTAFTALVAFRGLTSINWVNLILGVAALLNPFFAHQRGKVIGFYIVVAQNGSHFAPIVNLTTLSRKDTKVILRYRWIRRPSFWLEMDLASDCHHCHGKLLCCHPR